MNGLRLGGVAVLALLQTRQFIARPVRAKLVLDPGGSCMDKLRAIGLDNDLAGDGSEAMAGAALGTVSEMMYRIRNGKWLK